MCAGDDGAASIEKMPTDDLSIFESWVDLGIILVAMGLLLECTHTDISLNARIIFRLCMFGTLVIAKTIIDIVRTGKNAER